MEVILAKLLDGVALPQRVVHVGQPLGMRRHQPLRQNLRFNLRSSDAFAGIESANAFHQRFFKGASDGHHFAHGFHLRAKALVGAGELLELPLGNFYDHIVERRLKACRGLARDVVRNFVERVANREFGGDFCDRETGSF